MDCGWRQRLVNLDGKTLLIGFGIILRILGLFFFSDRNWMSSYFFCIDFVYL